MSNKLPASIAAFIQATHDHDIDALTARFTEDVTVHDGDGKNYDCREAISRWSQGGLIVPKVTLNPTKVAQVGEEIIITVTAAEGFPGSPMAIYLHFTLASDLIVSLRLHS